MAISFKSLNGIAALKKVGLPQPLLAAIELTGVEVKLTSTEFKFSHPAYAMILSVPVNLNDLQMLNAGTLAEPVEGGPRVALQHDVRGHAGQRLWLAAVPPRMPGRARHAGHRAGGAAHWEPRNATAAECSHRRAERPGTGRPDSAALNCRWGLGASGRSLRSVAGDVLRTEDAQEEAVPAPADRQSISRPKVSG